MRSSSVFVLIACLISLASGDVLGQSEWEFLGPDVGYRPDAFFVTQHAIYIGLAEEDDSGLGLYRYRFDGGEWDLFAWEGYRIPGVVVWGDSDENILLLRYGPYSASNALRSTDGGETWIETYAGYGYRSGISQAPSDTSRVITHDPPIYSTDGGWSWNVPGGYPPSGGTFDVTFDPANELVAYLTGLDGTDAEIICKSTDGGAYWSLVCLLCQCMGIEVDRSQTDRVMGGRGGYGVRLTTNAGEDWFVRDTPFITKEVCAPPWSPGTFFVAGTDSARTMYEVWRTEDFGQTWFACGGSLPEYPGSYLGSVHMYLQGHPTEPAIYAALEGSGIWRWNVSVSALPDADTVTTPGIRLSLYPNPSTSRCKCGVHLRRAENIVLTLYDVHARHLRTIVEGHVSAGTHIFTLQDEAERGSMPVSGIYYLRLDAGGSRAVQKVTLVR